MLQNYNFFIFSPKFSFDRIESFRFRFCAEKLNFAAVDQFFFRPGVRKKVDQIFHRLLVIIFRLRGYQSCTEADGYEFESY